jgi:hypothetical protein
MNLFEKIAEGFEPGPGGVVSLEPQPFLHGGKAAPKSKWVTVKALWYRPSDWLEGLRRIWRRFEDEGAIGGKGPFPVASSPETTPPGLGSIALGSTGGLS